MKSIPVHTRMGNLEVSDYLAGHAHDLPGSHQTPALFQQLEFVMKPRLPAARAKE
jgi:hypothetical protein